MACNDILTKLKDTKTPIIVVQADDVKMKEPYIMLDLKYKLTEDKRLFVITNSTINILTDNDQKLALFKHNPLVIILYMDTNIIEKINRLYPRSYVIANNANDNVISFLQKRNNLLTISRLYYTVVDSFIDYVVQDKSDYYITQQEVDHTSSNITDNIYHINMISS